MLALLGPSVDDAPPAPTPPPRYSGAFIGVEAGSGLAFSTDGREEAGFSARLALRASTVLQLADVNLGFDHERFEGPVAYRLSLATQLHPMFLFMLGNDRLWMSLASIYLRLGLGASFLRGRGVDDWGGSWDWGVGLDVPLFDPDAGQSLWLGAEYRRTSLLDPPPGHAEPGQTTSLRLGWRVNAL